MSIKKHPFQVSPDNSIFLDTDYENVISLANAIGNFIKQREEVSSGNGTIVHALCFVIANSIAHAETPARESAKIFALLALLVELENVEALAAHIAANKTIEEIARRET